MGGDHAFKFGGYWRDAYSESIGHTGGFATARFPTAGGVRLRNTCATGRGGGLRRGADARQPHAPTSLTNISAFVQDTFTRGRVTLPARRCATTTTTTRRSAATDRRRAAILPERCCPPSRSAASIPTVVFDDFSPRLGITYDVHGQRQDDRARQLRALLRAGRHRRASPARSTRSPRSRSAIPWKDLNGDRFVQAERSVPDQRRLRATYQALTGNWDPANPASPTTANTIDPNLKNDTTDEFIVGASREIGRGFAVDANYIWRSYDNFSQSFTNGLEQRRLHLDAVHRRPAPSPARAARP